MSPLNPKFPERARRFPGLVSAPTIDWFLPWPEEALVAVSKGFLGKFEMACDDDIKGNMMTTMGMCHAHTTDVCLEYFENAPGLPDAQKLLIFYCGLPSHAKNQAAERSSTRTRSIPLGLEKA